MNRVPTRHTTSAPTMLNGSAFVEPLAVLTAARAQLSGYASLFRSYRPPVVGERVGGDLDDHATLPRVLPSAAADGELMLLCIGGSGSMRTGTNLVLNFRSMGLSHMLIFAPDRATCTSLWDALPDLACVWWPSIFRARRPHSHYNTQFNPVALAFFEARKQAFALCSNPRARLRSHRFRPPASLTRRSPSGVLATHRVPASRASCPRPRAQRAPPRRRLRLVCKPMCDRARRLRSFGRHVCAAHAHCLPSSC